jgi:hypothetical protein
MKNILITLGIMVLGLATIIGMVFILEIGKAVIGLPFVIVVLAGCLVAMFFYIYNQLS